jgi:hypothetical protein
MFDRPQSRPWSCPARSCRTAARVGSSTPRGAPLLLPVLGCAYPVLEIHEHILVSSSPVPHCGTPPELVPCIRRWVGHYPTEAFLFVPDAYLGLLRRQRLRHRQQWSWSMILYLNRKCSCYSETISETTASPSLQDESYVIGYLQNTAAMLCKATPFLMLLQPGKGRLFLLFNGRDVSWPGVRCRCSASPQGMWRFGNYLLERLLVFLFFNLTN